MKLDKAFSVFPNENRLYADNLIIGKNSVMGDKAVLSNDARFGYQKHPTRSG